MSANKLSTSKKLMFSGMILLTLILGMEFTLRVKYALDGDNWRILISPFGQNIELRKVDQTDGPLDFRYSTEQSYTYFNTHEQKNYTINITNQGLFYHSLLEKEDTSSYRIFCIGGSSTFGNQSYKETWPGYLEQCLSDRYGERKIEVINYGQPGLGLLQLILRIKQQVLDYHPDLLIYYGAYNDADKITSLRTERIGRRLAQGLQQGEDTLPLLVGIHNLLHRKWSYLYTYLLEKYELIKYTYSAGYVDIQGYGQLLDELLSICREHGIDLVLVSQVLDVPDYPAEFENISFADSISSKKYYRENIDNAAGNHEVWITFRQRTLIKQQREFCRINGLSYLDLRHEFKNYPAGDRNKFYDIVHLSSMGNEILASIICRELELQAP